MEESKVIPAILGSRQKESHLYISVSCQLHVSKTCVSDMCVKSEAAMSAISKMPHLNHADFNYQSAASFIGHLACISCKQSV